jgi:hypothetical protein
VGGEEGSQSSKNVRASVNTPLLHAEFLVNNTQKNGMFIADSKGRESVFRIVLRIGD